MGDVRFETQYRRVAEAGDRAGTLRQMEDEQVVEALAAASRADDLLLANVLATEAANRMRRLRASLAHLAEGVLTLDMDGRVRWANPAAGRLLGWTWAEMSGAPFDDVLRHEHPEGEACQLLAAEAPVAADGEWIRLKDGRRACLTATSAPILAPDGEPEGRVVAFSDCTARKEGEERYRALFRNSPDAIATVDPEGGVLDANPAMERLMGVAIEDARGRPFGAFIHEDDVERAARLFADVLLGEPTHDALRVLRHDGSEMLVEAFGIPILVDGRVVGVHGVVRPLVAG